MKTLKKVLSVALVLAMALSLVTLVGAANVSKYQDFTDADAIVNKEAVDTLVGLRVLDGLEDGSFGPEGYLTRAQAAAIIARMLLGRTVADSMVATTAPFADVPANHWAAKYIQYCVSRGIINGMGDNTFVPNGEVTAAQFAKMLLVAAGYGKKGEYVGNDWAINAIVDAQNLGILDTNVDFMAPATRDEVARYAFNFYTKVAFVTYSKDKEDYDKKKDDTNNPLTLAVQQSVEEQSAGVVGGIPMRKWVKYDHNGTPVYLTGNAFPSTNIRVLYSYADGSAFNALTTIGNPAFKVALESVLPGGSVDYYYNGKLVDDGDEETPSESGLASALNSGRKGWVVQLLDTNRNGYADTVLVIVKTVGLVGGEPYITTAKKIVIPGIITAAANVDASKVVGYEGLKANDVVLYYKDLVTGVYYIEKAKSVTGQLTSARSGNQTVTFAGSTYGFSVLAPSGHNYGSVAVAANFNVDATIYLDDGNNIVYFKKASAAPVPTYVALLTGYQYDPFYGTAAAKIVKDDGTTATYSVAAGVAGVPDQRRAFAGVEGNPGEEGDPTAYFVTYSINAEGKITLTPVEDTSKLFDRDPEEGTLGYAAGSAQVVIEAVDEEGNPTSKVLYLTANSKVFYFDNTRAVGYDYGEDASPRYNNVRVTTGYAKTAAVDAGKTVYYVLAPNTTNVVSAILFCDSKVLTDIPSYKYVYVTPFSGPDVTYVNGEAIYTYHVYANGEADTIKSKNGSLFSGAGLYALSIDSLGFATLGSQRYVVSYDEEVEFIDAGYIVVDGDQVIKLTPNTKFYRYEATAFSAVVYEDTIGALNSFVTYTVTDVQEDAQGNAVAVYFTYEIL